jgi:adenylylsulfate kinase-like enzyme
MSGPGPREVSAARWREKSGCCRCGLAATIVAVALGDRAAVAAVPGSDARRSGGPGCSDPVPVLWLCGPCGVGKTTVAWEIYAELARAGAEVGYVDIDQLGMCFPEPAADPGRHRMQAENLNALVATFQAAGARYVVVSGVVHPVDGVYREMVPQAALRVCRLRADADDLTRRLLERHGAAANVPQELAEAEALDANNIGDLCIETTGRSVAEVVRLVHEHTTGWMAPASTHPPTRPVRSDRPRSAGADGPILWLCGPTGVGKSTIGFAIYTKTVIDRRIPGAYIDLDQVGFLSPTPSDDPANHRVKAHVLAALWRTFRAAGAQCLTIVGPAPNQATITTYTDALPAATFTVCRLHAGPDELTRRILLRGPGGSWAQPGDPLKDLPDAHLRDIADLAAAQAEALDQASVGDIRINTADHTAEQTADEIIAQTRWPHQPQTAPPRPSSP